MASAARIAFIFALSLCHPAAAQQPNARPGPMYIDPPAEELIKRNPYCRAVGCMDAEDLIREGNKRMRGGDILEARELYQKAVELGGAEAALAMGRSYDPIYLQRIEKKNAEPDKAKAYEWYKKARDLGTEYMDPPPSERNHYYGRIGD
jgi:hypothetical protein